MYNGDERPRPGDQMPARRSRRRQPRLLVALIISLAVFCHNALGVDATVVGSTAESSLALLAQEGTPTHALSCSVDSEPAMLYKLRGGTVWASQSLSAPAWLLTPDEGPAEARLPLITSSPGARRALLQIFRI